MEFKNRMRNIEDYKVISVFATNIVPLFPRWNLLENRFGKRFSFNRVLPVLRLLFAYFRRLRYSLAADHEKDSPQYCLRKQGGNACLGNDLGSVNL